MSQLEHADKAYVFKWKKLNKGALKDTYDVLLKSKHEDNDDVYVNPSKKQEYIDLLGPELKSRYNEFKSTGRDRIPGNSMNSSFEHCCSYVGGGRLRVVYFYFCSMKGSYKILIVMLNYHYLNIIFKH